MQAVNALTTVELSGNTNPVQLPSDFQRFIREDARKWLDQFQLTPLETDRAGIGWSDARESLIFPIKYGSLVSVYQSRYFGDDESQPKWRTIGSKTLVHNIDPIAKDRRVILVEDLISGIKCSRVTNTVPLFGSLIHELVVSELVKNFDSAIIWMDPDAKMKAMKIALTLGEAGLESRIIFSDQDPKWYLTSDIRRIVNEGE